METSSFNVTEEVEKIFEIAWKTTKENRFTEIKAPIVFASVIELYLNPEYKRYTKNEVNTKIFSSLSTLDRSNMLTSARDIPKHLSGSVSDPELISYTIPFSKELLKVMEGAKKMNIKVHWNDRIESDSLMVYLLKSQEVQKFEISKRFGIDGLDELFGLEDEGISSDNIPESAAKSIMDTLSRLLKEDDKSSGPDRIINPQKLSELLKKEGNVEDMSKKDDENFEKYGESNPISTFTSDPNSKTPTLDQFSIDMTKYAKEGKYDQVIGRDDTVGDIIKILSKRKKPNVGLVGEAGVGKSTVIERLAQKISEGTVPDRLKDKRVCSLNLNDLVAGTRYRGEYEERLQKIIKEVCEEKNVIVYIDELHSLVGNGGEKGSGDGANILKPYLARGEFQCIGSTTNEEYRKFIEKDKALDRRFTKVQLSEPTPEETVKILRGISKHYEDFHKVKISPKLFETLVDWSGRYLVSKNFPDKAIDVLDLASASVSIKEKKENEEVESLKNKIKTYEDDLVSTLVDKSDFSKSIEIGKDLEKLEGELETVKKKSESKKNWPEVTLDDIAKAISEISKIPIDKISQSDVDKLKTMKSSIEKVVIGQKEAIVAISEALTKNALGLRNVSKPIASFLMCGPTGVGKTLLAKEVANIFFGTPKSLIRIDCGALKDTTSVNTLIGSAPGYVGYDDAPILQKVKETPRCVLLFDEIEKAHEGIYDTLLSILDEGKIKLQNGDLVDFTNSIILFTSNLGAKEVRDNKGLGFGKVSVDQRDKTTQDIIKKAIERKFKPEFIGRLTQIVNFHELTEKELGKIFDLELGKIKKQLSKNKLSLNISPETKEKVIKSCKKGLGARELSGLIEKEIVSPISTMILENPETKKFSL